MRTREIMTVSLPPAMIKKVEEVRKAEDRTRSELVREALRRYFEERGRVAAATEAELAAIRRGRAQIRRGQFVTLEKFLDELARPTRRPRKKRT
jgi:CopG family transcriptional regulator/antitoxin EndoAI